MILQNNPINTLFALYTKFGFSRSVIKLLIKRRSNFIIKNLLSKTTLIWRGYNYFLGLKNSIIRKDKEKGIIIYMPQ